MCFVSCLSILPVPVNVSRPILHEQSEKRRNVRDAQVPKYSMMESTSIVTIQSRRWLTQHLQPLSTIIAEYLFAVPRTHLEESILQNLSISFHLQLFKIMRFSAPICYLASLMATLVLVTTSLPQPPSHPPDGISNRSPRDHPSPFKLPEGCIRIGADGFQHDIWHKLVKRDSQSSRTPARVVEPRQINLPCGIIRGGGQSHTMQFQTHQILTLRWKFTSPVSTEDIVRLMVDNTETGGQIVRLRRAARRHLFFTPDVGHSYYIQVLGTPLLVITWYFENGR